MVKENIMKRWISVLLAASALFASCGGAGNREAQGVVTAVEDTAVVRDAQAAANELVRNASDCERVKSLFTDVTAKLDAAASQVQSEAGRTTIDTLRRQVGPIAEACGLR
jgi:hypothetical protein